MASRMARSSLESHSAWEDGLNLIDELLVHGSPTAAAMTEEQKVGLKRLKVMLLSGSQRNENHVPVGLLLSDQSCADTDFLLRNFAGFVPKDDSSSRKVTRIVAAHKIARMIKSKVRSSSMQLTSSYSDVHIPEQWFRLDATAQRRLCDLLSWKSLCSWDFNVFDVDAVLKGKNTLVFVAWAILTSPNAQFAMEMECNGAVTDNNNNNSSSSSSDYNIRNRNVDGDDIIPIGDRHGYNFTEELGIKDEKLTGYLTTIENQYLDNAYHNKIHAADVIQTVHALIQMGGSRFFNSDEPVEAFALLLAAAVHDVGHPGMNNSYQKSSQSQLAITYNDKSILENMHASRAFQIIMGDGRDENCDILSSFTDERKEKFRDIVINTVLSTDMTKHFSKKNFIKGVLLNNELEGLSGDVPHEIDISDPTTKMHILGYMLHLADISNPAKRTNLASSWADRILEEFFQQGDREACDSLPISPLCDRRTTSRSQSQIGFINFIVLPAYEVLARLIPQVETTVLPQIRRNLEYWEELKLLEKDGTMDQDQGAS